jgi:hypothetical protein
LDLEEIALFFAPEEVPQFGGASIVLVSHHPAVWHAFSMLHHHSRSEFPACFELDVFGDVAL